jgi:hypothetical protein
MTATHADKRTEVQQCPACSVGSIAFPHVKSVELLFVPRSVRTKIAFSFVSFLLATQKKRKEDEQRITAKSFVFSNIWQQSATKHNNLYNPTKHTPLTHKGLSTPLSKGEFQNTTKHNKCINHPTTTSLKKLKTTISLPLDNTSVV